MKNPDSKSKIEIWESDGWYHQTWHYNRLGIDISFAGSTKTNLKVEGITIFSPCKLKTKRYIGIGSTFQDVMNIYKSQIEPNVSDDEIIIVGTIYDGFVFRFIKNKVVSIFLGASAE